MSDKPEATVVPPKTGQNINRRRMNEYVPFLLQHLDDLLAREVLIIGDVGLDAYVLGQVRRISQEAPVPVVEVDSEESRLGLAANVAQNVASLGGKPKLISVVGADAAAHQLRTLLTNANADPGLLVVDVTRPTTRKLRIMVDRHHVVRVDYEQRQFISEAIEDQILKRVADNLATASVVIIEDYGKGVITERLVKEIVRLSHDVGLQVMVDPHRQTPAETYRGVDLLKPNHEEAEILAGISESELRKNPEHLNLVAEKLISLVGCSQLVITRGKDGMRLYDEDDTLDLPTSAKEVFDVSGAGDTVIAALALGWGSGFSLEQACALANFAAGVVVAHVGCVPCTKPELLAAIHAADV